MLSIKSDCITCDITKKYYINVYSFATNRLKYDFKHTNSGDLLRPHMISGDEPFRYTWDITNGFALATGPNDDKLEEKNVIFGVCIRIKVSPECLRKYSKYVGYNYVSAGHLTYVIVKYVQMLVTRPHKIYPIHYLMPKKYAEDSCIMTVRVPPNSCKCYINISEVSDYGYNIIESIKYTTGQLENLVQQHTKIHATACNFTMFADFNRCSGDVKIITEN